MDEIDDAALFERIVSGNAPADDQGNVSGVEKQPEAEADLKAQPRDESGKFASKAQPEPAAQSPASDSQQQSEPAIPPHRLREEADARRAEKERADRLEMEMAQMRQFIIQQQRQSTQPQQPQEPPDMFTDPDAWFRHQSQQQFAPVQQQINAFQQRMVAMDRAIAGAQFGKNEVDAAEKAFNELHARGALDPADLHKIANAENRFAAAVEWRKRNSLLSEIGNDPAAYRERIKSEILAEMNAGAQQQQQQPPANVVKIPPSLNRATSAAPANQGGGQALSDTDLFNKITSGRR